MRHLGALVVYVLAVVIAAASCSASGRSGDRFTTTGVGAHPSSGTATGGSGNGGSGNGGLGNLGGSIGSFATSSSSGDGGTHCAAYKGDCTAQKLDCGKAGDGCGNILNCGTCPAGQVCGIGGTANVCATPICAPQTCMSLNATCGTVPDGCGNNLNCGTCASGMTCGSKVPNQCGMGPCTPKTCQSQSFTCGMQSDGCGNLLDCGSCATGQACTMGMCTGMACVPQTCMQQGFNCGAATDGCNNVIMCGTCPAGQSCGSGGPNICGASSVVCMAGQLCMQQMACGAGTSTTVTGTVYAPNGIDPLPNTLVYVPNLGTAGLTNWQDGVNTPHCSCSEDISGDPLVSGVTDYTGSFSIANMPVGASIPLVLQNGRWRRVVTIANVPSCMTTTVGTPFVKGAMPNLTVGLSNGSMRMPQVQHETTQWDNIPKMGFVTGSVDALECALRKMGIQDSEFQNPGGTGRVEMYQGAGFAGATLNASTPSETALWTTPTVINGYDMVYFACQGSPFPEPTGLPNVQAYANAGGRIFSTHYSYTWIDNAPWDQTATWTPNAATFFTNDPGVGQINTSFTAGSTLSQWLFYIGASTTMGQMPIAALRNDFTGVNAPAELWVTEVGDPSAGSLPMHYTFDTPWMAPQNKLCGRVLYDDFHVEDASTSGTTFPQECGLCAAQTCTPQTCSPQTCAAQSCLAQSCLAQTCFPQSCTDSLTGGTCNPADGCFCSGSFATCTKNSDCSAGTCSLTSAACNTNADCAGQCSSTSTTCKTNADCAGQCSSTFTACNTSADCAGQCSLSATNCNTNADCSGECSSTFTTCNTNADCGGQCSNTFSACSTSAPCSNVCSNSGVACASNADCSAFSPQEKMLEFFLFNLGGCVQPPMKCVPKGCPTNQTCGPAADGCGNIIMCGTCPSGQSCVNGSCTQLCTPETCMQLNATCGMQGDGCGNAIDCGNCAAGNSCVNGQCMTGGCTPTTCKAKGYVCGEISDGCGNVINCGTCPSGEICGGGGTPGQCYTPPCTKATCAGLGYNCGMAPDGCGGVLTCGTCTNGQICGGGTPPQANVCGGGAN